MADVIQYNDPLNVLGCDTETVKPGETTTQEHPESGKDGGVSEGAIDKVELVACDNPLSTDYDKENPMPKTEYQTVANGNCAQTEKDKEETVKGKKKFGRRVTFPSNVINGYHEPSPPWNNVSECSTEELIAAYKKSCVKHDVKPLPKLLQQLHVITNFHDRNETLTLRGESLNIRHIETLEEILRRVQFRTIDLEASHLDEESAIAVFDMVEFYQSALRINISYNKIGLRGWQSCSRMLKKTPCVQHLDARCCSLTEQVLPIFGRALRLGSMLKILHLENSIMSGRSLMILVAAVKMNDILEELFLADNKLMPSDGIQLGNLLKFNHKLRLLDVRNNHLGDVGSTHISDGLYEQTMGHGLETLVLWNNQITYQSMIALGRALKSTKSIETLNLGHNNITNEGIHRVKDGLMHNKSLLRIGLQAAKISCEGAVALAECIAESPILVRLDLRENDIKTGGLMALSLALKVNESVNRIDIDQTPKKESGIKDFADQQRRLLQDINNYSQRNRDVTLRKEEEERQRKLEEEIKAALEEEVEEAKETTVLELEPGISLKTEKDQVPDPEPIKEEDSVEQIIEILEGQDISDDSEKDLENHQLRMQLHLPIPSRSQSLDSPVDAPEIDYPPLKIPATVKEQDNTTNQQVKQESPLPPEFPPSPMVSHEGKTIHAMISGKPAIPLLMEPALLKNETSSTQYPQPDAPNPSNLSPDKSEKVPRTPSPLSRRKFTISKVAEPKHSNVVSSQLDLGDPLGVASDAEIKTLSGTKPKQQQKLPSTEQFVKESETNKDPSVKESKTNKDQSVKESETNKDQSVKESETNKDQSVKETETNKFSSFEGNSKPDLNESSQEGNVDVSGDHVTQPLDKYCDEQKMDSKSSGQNASVSSVVSKLPSETSNVITAPSMSGSPNNSVDSTCDGLCKNSGDTAIKTTCDNPVNTSQTVVSSYSSDSNTHSTVEHSINQNIVNTMETGASASGCGDAGGIVSLNGVRIDVSDLLEGADAPELKVGGGDSASTSLDLLSSADDFEKELDDMLANVQGGAKYSPEAVQSNGTS